MNHRQQEAAIATAAAEFPAEFGLRAFPGDRFKIVPRDCYMRSETEVMLYTHVKRGDTWLAFAKGTPAELKAEMVKL